MCHRLNQDLLTDVVVKCGGQQIVAESENNNDLAQITNWIANFERHKTTDKLLTIKQERYYYFLALAFLFLLVEWLL